MATTSYHCPSCSAPIEFNPELQLFSCDYCMSQFTSQQMEELTANQEKRDSERAKRKIERAEAKAAENPSETEIHEYNCSNCGAHVVTDETTTSTFCYYCHSGVIITSRLQGDFRPDQILPFSVDEETAKKGFLDWASTKKYLPPDFTSQAHLEKMTGLYVPYWFMDSDVDVDFKGKSDSVRTWRSGSYQYTETTTYDHVRKGVYHLTDVNQAAFGKIDENLLNGIEPFEPDALVPFSMPMLSGFFAEQFTLDEAEAKPQLDQQVEAIAQNLLNRSLSRSSGIQTIHLDMDSKPKELLYTLLPVWVLTYQYGGKTYVYSMNGQTGKAFGELPLVEGKLNRDSLLRGLLLGLIAAIAVFLFFWFMQ